MKKVSSMFSRMLWFWPPCWWSISLSPMPPSTTILLAPTVKQISHLLANQVKLIFPVESNQLALSEDAEALVYVATGSDIYTQTEAEQHGLNESKPYTYLEESISRELGQDQGQGRDPGSLHHLDPAAPGQQGVGAHPADRDRGRRY